MKAYNNDPKLKAHLVGCSLENERLDRYIKGVYSNDSKEEFKGCSVGCTINDYNKLTGNLFMYGDHGVLADVLGVPLFITLMQDHIFEGLPSDLRYAWTPRFLSAIPLDADLSSVRDKFVAVYGLRIDLHVYADPHVRADAARADADAARAARADADAYAARADAVRAYAARADAYAARAARADAYADARYTNYADTLIKLIGECK